MVVAALVMYGVGLILAFGVRSYLVWRRLGDAGFRRPAARPGEVSWWGSVAFVVACVLGVIAPVASLTGVVTPLFGLPGAVLGVAGLVAMAVGLGVVLAAQSTMGASWRIGVDPDERTDLVTGGIFAWVRNPVFTGMLLVMAGMVAAVPTLVSVSALAALVVAVEIQVRLIEEPYLRSVHPEYVTYAARTGRFVPGVGRERSTRGGIPGRAA